MKIGGRVYNMCLSGFMVETSRYHSPRINQCPLRRTLAFLGQDCRGSVHPRGESIGRKLVDWASIPSVDKNLDKSLKRLF